MKHPRTSSLALLAMLSSLLLACSSPPSPLLAEIPVEVDGQPSGILKITEEGSLIVEALPTAPKVFAEAALVVIDGANRRTLRINNPAHRNAPEDLRFVFYDGKAAIAWVPRAQGALPAQKPTRVLLEPLKISIFSTIPQAPKVSLKALKVRVDGKAVDDITDPDLKALTQKPVTGPKDRAKGWDLIELVALRAPSFTSLELVGKDGESVALALKDFEGADRLLLAGNRKGTWTFKHFDASANWKVSQNLRGVQELRVTTK